MICYRLKMKPFGGLKCTTLHKIRIYNLMYFKIFETFLEVYKQSRQSVHLHHDYKQLYGIVPMLEIL